jgi:hypothetical protein
VDLSGTSWGFDYSESVRYLGFFLKDGGGDYSHVFDVDFHIASRCNPKANAYELLILKWCANNYYFSNSVKRSILLTRSVPKLFFGTQGMI